MIGEVGRFSVTLFPGRYRFLPCWKKRLADFAYGSVTTPRRTMFPSIVDDLQMQNVPGIAGKQGF